MSGDHAPVFFFLTKPGNPICRDSSGSIRLKKIRLMYLLDLFEGRKGSVISMCGAPYSRVVSVVLVLSGVGPVLRSRYGIE